MLKEKYLKEIVPALKESLQISNVMEVPKIEKIVLNMWISNLELECLFD